MAVMAASTGSLVRTLFIVLFCVMVVGFVYLFIFGEFLSCFDFHWRWFTLVTADFTVYAVVIGAWVAYKESSWIRAAIVIVTIYLLGSLISIGYILIQFHKLSHEEYLNDPLYFLLTRQYQKREVSKGPSVVGARIMFSVLGCLVLGVLIYTIIMEFSASYKYFTSCFATIAIDIYIHVVIFSVWITYKESSWASAFFWTALLICFRGVTICAYIVRELFYLSPQQPVSLIIVKSGNRDLHSSDPPLMAHPNI